MGRRRLLIISVVLSLLAVLLAAPASASDDHDDDRDRRSGSVRFATFNASLNRLTAGALADELSAPGSPQPDVIAEIIQRARPEVLLINEFDYDDGNVALDGFQTNYLSIAHGTAAPIEYPYRYTAPSNTGIFSGFDLDNSGEAGDFVPNDSFGFGFFPGQYGMA
ncbi:MAG: endonuclease/exonuclease/phosphatase family protein, partial [Actinomycetia bacterium]|nr:endonuclease/exonuclease/phosphatase family protein [Actinomycetes bacterium]